MPNTGSLSPPGLTRSKFVNANLSGSDLSGGNLSGDDFTGANLTGAHFHTAYLGSVIWSNTTCPDGTNSSSYSPQTCVGHGI